VEVYEIVESVDILEYISQFCDPVEKEDGEYWCLSPLKDERTPSFSINTEMQKFYDFSSGKGGNVLDFICAYHNCGFLKGLDILKRYAGITDDEQQTSAPRRLAATTVAKRFQVRHKKEKQSKTYVLQSDYMNRYEWDVKKLAVWEREGISMESMAKFQVRYDPFYDRLVYPIRDVSGNIISVCGRTLDPHYKEKNLRKYTYFQYLGTLDTIYGLSDNIAPIRAKGEIILFEGAKSVMMADGCVIEGEVENSVIFRGVKVGKGAKIKNCILMQDTVVEAGANVEYLITDKNVTISAGKEMKGTDTFPVYIEKFKTV